MPRITRILPMIVMSVVTALVVLALVTQAGIVAVQRAFPPQGEMVDVDGATLHVVDIGPRDAGLPIVMLHGASSNLEAMRRPLGDIVARDHRVILVDRPGHGWSTRARRQDSTPQIQARMIDEALAKLGIERAVFVVHSWSGALGARLALDHPGRVAGLVMLAPVTHPWRGGVGRYNEIIATPVIGPLLAYTITLPLGYFLAEPGARSVFLPQMMPDGFVRDSATPLLLRPREFIANAYDLVTLKQAVAAQVARYGEIQAPVTVIAGEPDKTVKTNIHARPFAATVPNAKLIVLPDLGHMVQNAVPDRVKAEIEAMLGRIVPAQAAAD
ncbi:alpha/beta hydrolase [Bradyrhizobium sp. WBOS7]|uniref:Alpha/beta hydrolase n=2 Tax=Nitrobacteraceae TaxID=41294 RepID=A0AAE9SU83_9BRAD|nr:alpha/beta hydrolase [Bradyrhizobium sp. WBOS2]MDD1570621.1 alpha/beta hydrolase [Bradyrhizobium sp. WBOS1]MDD1578379.1 alpha/beta hydrolase [Bradyrhizobium sp. WBOS7]MDD1601102.1 alpha/beta hydrolase [Bradyrhizobium sp. WBOS16]UUO34916.1 alpha/beta hydrolase [Bradyrhizobium sp. WBOS01]UUO41244.1 alpha/beta hydrolase [Bradyrhizobium sp. WBOS02]UUO55561.1 alpha/beta hydrolase [Bradyrhizobium sp. WBOS07]UUO65611.1 alpha/beta hydrolase [Bradyrhizobium betae]